MKSDGRHSVKKDPQRCYRRGFRVSRLMAAHDSRLAQSAIFLDLVPFKFPMGRRHVGDEDLRSRQMPTPDVRHAGLAGLADPFPIHPGFVTFNPDHPIFFPFLLATYSLVQNAVTSRLRMASYAAASRDFARISCRSLQRNGATRGSLPIILLHSEYLITRRIADASSSLPSNA